MSWPEARSAHTTVAPTAPTVATAEASPSIATSTAAMPNAGAITRRAVGGIGRLPHDDPTTAAELVLRCLPELPAVPQLPGRDPREGMLAQWLVALPEVEVARDGSLTVLGESDAAPECVFDDRAHSGLLA